MSLKKLKKALKDPKVVSQIQLRDGRVVELTGADDTALREALRATPGYGEPSKPKAKPKKRRTWVSFVSGGSPGLGKRR